MIIVKEYPPNIETLRKFFTLSEGTAFTYGDTLYNPDNGPIDAAFIIHEKTHQRQQEKMTPEKWWDLYCVSTDFRASQEVEAYQNQYREQKKYIKDKNQLDRYVRALAKDLSGAMYGNVMTFSQAMEVIKSPTLVTFDLPDESMV